MWSVAREPKVTNGFVGRAHELERLSCAVTRGSILTLTGPGGVGKTALAAQFTEHDAGIDSRAVWTVRFDQADEGGLVPIMVAQAIGLTSPEMDCLPNLLKWFRSETGVLLLDNCEHLAEAISAFADALLSECPGIAIVATSRTPLGSARELQFEVEPLRVPDATTLFLSRAQLQPAEAERIGWGRGRIAELCVRLDGIPLAIELAAARVAILGPDDLLAGGSRLSDLLRDPDPARPARHRTMTASLDWSHRLCSPAEQRAWEALAVLERDFGLDLAIALLRAVDLAEEAEDLILALVHKSIVSTFVRDGSVRFRMLDSTRAFGCSRGAELIPRVEQAIVDHVSAIGRDAARDMLTDRQAHWRRVGTLDHGSIRQATEIALRRPDLTPHLADILWRPFHSFWWSVGFFSELGYWATRLLAVERGETEQRARALTIAAVTTVEPGLAQLRFEEARHIAQILDREDLRGIVALFTGLVALTTGDFQTARSSARSILERVPEGSLLHLDALHLMSNASEVLGDREASEAASRRVLALVEPLEEVWYRSRALRTLAIHNVRAGDTAQALRMARRALDIVRTAGPAMLFPTIQTIAMITEQAGDDVRAAYLDGAVLKHLSVMESLRRFLVAAGDIPRMQRGLARRLGADRLEAERRRGAAADLADIVAVAAGGDLPPAEGVPPAWEAALTKREREVAALVVTGATNKQIAADLIISPRTAESHVERILRKLDLNSRAQLAALHLPAVHRATEPVR